MRPATLEEAQSAMKERLERRETAKRNICSMGTAGKRRSISHRQSKTGSAIGVSERQQNRRSVRINRDPDGKKYRERLCQEKGVISHHLEVDEIFLTNTRDVEKEPPAGQPLEYYLFVTLVIQKMRRRGPTEERFRYVETLEGATVEACDEALLEFVTRPGVVCESVKNI